MTSQPSIKVVPHQSKPLVWWYTRRAQIDMEPPYQRRGRLWSQGDKGYLIDSLINGFDVPKLYLADFQTASSALNTKRLPYAIIDGKQRLEAIFDFFDGTLTLNHDFVWRANPKERVGGLSLRDLKARYPYLAETFESETVDVMSVYASNVDDINELFIRLNRSKPLTGAEIRNAMTGDAADGIRLVKSHPFFKETIKFKTTRGEDVNAASKLVLFEYYEKLMSTKRNDLDEFTRNRKVDRIVLEAAVRRCLEYLDYCQEVFLPKDPLLGSAGPLPIYYWLVRAAAYDRMSIIREFLVFFERIRQSSRSQQILHIIEGNDKAADQLAASDFARYDALNRSVNDVGSHTGRFEILLRYFTQFSDQRLVAP